MAGLCAAQTAVERDISLPDGRAATEILMYLGDVKVTGSEVRDGLTVMQGRVSVQLVCADANGIFGFTSGAAFSHTFACVCAKPHMTARVSAQLQTLEVKLTGAGASKTAALSAVVDIEARLTDTSPLPALCCEGNAGGLELDCKSTASRTAKYDYYPVRTRDEVEAGDTEEILCFDTAAQLDGETGSGSVIISALVKTTSGELREACYTLPFKHEAPDPVCVSVDAAYMRCLREEFAVIVVETQLTVTSASVNETEVCVPVAAYSTLEPLCAVTAPASFISYSGGMTECAKLTEDVALSPGLPAIHHAAYAACRVGVTERCAENGRLLIEGLLFTKIIYHTESGAYFSMSEDVPFTLDYKAPDADLSDVSVTAIAAIKSAAPDRVRLEYSLFICSELFQTASLSVVTDMEHCECAPVRRGIVVCFALPGETLFDIGRRYNIPTARIRETNPALEGEPRPGDRLTLLI